MIWTIGISVVIIWGVLAGLYLLGVFCSDFPGRTIDDVVEFLRPVDLDQAEVLLDRGANLELRWKLDSQTYCEMQRKRMRVYLELVQRMAYNARVLVEFGNREALRLERCEATERNVRHMEVISALQHAAVKVRIYSLLTILKLRGLMAIRPMLTPSLVRFRVAGKLDGIVSYKTLREASTAVFREFRRPTDKLVLNL